MLWMGILTFVALSLTSVITINDVFVQGFGNNVFMMVFFYVGAVGCFEQRQNF